MKNFELSGTIVHIDSYGVNAHLFIADRNDGIQKVQYGGEFWDPKDLEIMSRYIKQGCRYLDIGANVGNHTVYFAHKYNLYGIVVIEPNPVAINILRANLLLNNLGIDRVDINFLGYGLSNTDGLAMLDTPIGNLGGTRCLLDNGGKIPIITGDKLLGMRDFDFIKMDVEWMEMECLDGLKNLITRCRPVMYIEVSGSNHSKFINWCAINSYEICESLKFTSQQANYLVVPK